MRRRDRLYSLEFVLRVDPASAPFVDLLDGCLVGNPSLVELATPSRASTKVLVELTTRPCHHGLETGQFILQVFHGVVQDVQLGRLLPDHLPEIEGLNNVVLLNITNRYTNKTMYLGLFFTQHPPEAVNHV